MHQEIERILALVQSGKLTTAQAADLIASLRDAPEGEPASHEPRQTGPNEPHTRTSGDTNPSSGGAVPDPDFDDLHTGAGESDETYRDTRRARRGRRRHGCGGPHDRGRRHGDLGEDIERVVEFGTRTLRSVFKSGFGLSGDWGGGDANNSVLSRAEAPTGTEFTCKNNQFAVSHVSNIRLTRSTFSDNHVNAAGVEDVELVDSTFTGQHLNGSYLKTVLVEHGHVRNNELSGGRLSQLTVGNGRVENCSLNGSNLRDVGVSGSVMEDCRINGTRLKALVVSADSHVKGLSLEGVLARNWLIEGGVVSDTSFRGVRVDGFVLKRSGLEGVTFTERDFSARFDSRNHGLIRDLTLHRVVLKDCRFEHCRFDGTRLEGFEASGLEFNGVDFRGLTITSAAEFERLAGGRRVA